MLIKARYVVPVDAPVIEDGGVKIDAGRITAVGPARELSDDVTTDYGDAVICPGFVNAHTHLELTSCAGLVPPTPDFIDWLQHLIAVAKDTLATGEAVSTSVLAGIEQSLRSGVTLVGDITSRPDLSRPHLAKSALQCVSFGEVIAIGTLRDRVVEQLEAALDRELETATFRVGVSPHAPYTVEPTPMRRCAAQADEVDAPIAIHLAETDAETEFTRNGSGPFAQHLQALGVWDNRIPVPQCSAVELANRCGVLGPRTVIAHGNYVTDL
ncbi:MAG: amidohydrolase family protein, partial [Planctomycetes bacterium]|nr:amidohydrolase family protein [Planctomycetota bacterium]